MPKNMFVLIAALAAMPLASMSAQALDLKGAWAGKSEQVTAKTEFKERDILVNVLDQQGNRFWGTTSHGGETEKMIGVIRADGKSLYWVDVDDSGIVEGVVLGPDKIETCYLESGDHAIAACSVLTRKGK
jgi:hypothetical protein